MGLKIENICETSLKGELDGGIPVRGEISGGTIRIAIASWIWEASDDLLTGVAGLRYAVYAALAKYRFEQKAS